MSQTMRTGRAISRQGCPVHALTIFCGLARVEALLAWILMFYGILLLSLCSSSSSSSSLSLCFSCFMALYHQGFCGDVVIDGLALLVASTYNEPWL